MSFRIFSMYNPYRYLQAFSIDISIGSVIGALFVAKYIGVTLDFFVLVELFLAVWLIYTFDHLVDSGSGDLELVTFRHKLHRRLSTSIWGVWSFTLVVLLTLLFKIPNKTLIAGGILGLFVVIYFVLLKFPEDRKIYHKELSAAVIYATGIFLGPLTIYQGYYTLDLWILYSEFLVLALANLLMFSVFEEAIDQRSGFHSLVKSIGILKTKYIVNVLVILLILASSMGMLFYRNEPQIFGAQLTILVMVLVLALIIANRKSLIINQRFRIIADAIFFLPILYIVS